jgi:hypothetical protein
MIKMYNNHKGGTDQFDQSLLKYGIRIRSKKWYWSIFAWVLNASLVTSWHFYRDMKNSNLSLLSYSREVVTALLLQFGAPSKKAGKTNRFIAYLASTKKNFILRFVFKEQFKKCA